MKKIIILGSTGSIGRQTLDVIRANPGDFQVIGLSARKNVELLESQTREFKPKYVIRTSVTENPEQALASLASAPDADLIVNAISGYSGLMPTYAACKAGKRIALANKESLVMAGELLVDTANKTGAQILPIDSELSAVWRILRNTEVDSEVINGQTFTEKIILTASGGPFWKWRTEELKAVSASQALKHPTWKMGEKVTIDSATLMNKAFEIIGAKWLFNMPSDKIEVVVHRQSLVHSLVQFADGNIEAVLGPADMRIPICDVLYYPDRSYNKLPRLDFSQLQLTFDAPDYSVFEGPRLAYDVLAAGGIMPAVLCLADEIAVDKFLSGEISFLGIYDFIKRAISRVKNTRLSIKEIAGLKQRLM